MDEISVRARLDEVRTELARIDDERNALLTILRGYETGSVSTAPPLAFRCH